VMCSRNRAAARCRRRASPGSAPRKPTLASRPVPIPGPSCPTAPGSARAAARRPARPPSAPRTAAGRSEAGRRSPRLPRPPPARCRPWWPAGRGASGNGAPSRAPISWPAAAAPRPAAAPARPWSRAGRTSPGQPPAQQLDEARRRVGIEAVVEVSATWSAAPRLARRGRTPCEPARARVRPRTAVPRPPAPPRARRPRARRGRAHTWPPIRSGRRVRHRCPPIV
jgi:hypothetical protein